MKEINFTDKTKAKKLIDLILVCGIFALCVITVVATGKTNKTNTEVPVATQNQQYKADRTEPSATVDAEYEEETDKSIEAISSEKESSNEVTHTDDTHNQESVTYEFMLPVIGDVIREFSTDKLMYSPTMDDWRIHTGVDISSASGTAVVSAERGIVKSAGFDSALGYSVVVESGQYTCIYASLASNIAVSEGQEVSKGEIVGYVGDSMIYEICDAPHLHFEFKNNGEYVNPCEYIDL